MRSLAITSFAFMGVTALAPIAVTAQSLEFPLTPREHASMLTNGASRTALSILYPVGARIAAATPAHQQDYRTRYLSARLGDRVAIAQTIGEEGVEQYAAGQRLRTLLGPQGRSTPIGPDSVYWNRSSGTVRVLEAKGGGSAPQWTYGSRQGTNTNTIRSARGVLASTGASSAERLQAARIIKAAQRGHLETGVVNTPHVLGRPLAPRQVNGVNIRNVAREAREIEADLIRRNPELRSVFRKADFQHGTDRAIYLGAKSIPDQLSGAAGTITRTPTPRAGFHRLPGTVSLGGLVSGGGLQRVWQAANRWMLPAGLGVAGVTVASAYYRFESGSIGYPEFIRYSAGSAVLVVFTATGAVIGGVASFGSGAMAGAVIGATVALPVQIYIEQSNDPLHDDFGRTQQATVDKVIEDLYLTGAIAR